MAPSLISKFRRLTDMGFDADTLFGIGSNTGTRDNNPSNVTWYTAASFPINQTVLVVGGYTVNGAGTGGAGVTDDTHRFWLNPDPATFGAVTAPSPSATRTGGDISTGLQSFAFLNGGANRPAGYQFDNLRVGSSWDAVVPSTPAVWPGGRLKISRPASGGNRK
jgi:hypothetical protein